MYKQILLPHAGTKVGDKALEHAKKIANIHNSNITLLHIIEEISTPPSLGFTAERKEWSKHLNVAKKEMKNEMKVMMEKLADKIRSEKIPITVKVLIGYPDEIISKIANENNFDLIIMAKRKKLSGFKSILKLGSVSRKVLEKISCPIMLIDGEK